jgi:hypothetical protein
MTIRDLVGLGVVVGLSMLLGGVLKKSPVVHTESRHDTLRSHVETVVRPTLQRQHLPATIETTSEGYVAHIDTIFTEVDSLGIVSRADTLALTYITPPFNYFSVDYRPSPHISSNDTVWIRRDSVMVLEGGHFWGDVKNVGIGILIGGVAVGILEMVQGD